MTHNTDLIPNGWHVATDDEWKILEELSGLTDIQTNIIQVINLGRVE